MTNTRGRPVVVRTRSRRTAIACLAAAAVAGFGVVGANPAEAGGLGPAFYLYSASAGITGPCVEGQVTGTTLVAISASVWSATHTGDITEGNITYHHFNENAFNVAQRDTTCVTGYVTYKYYGATEGEIHRDVSSATISIKSSAPWPAGTVFGSWQDNWA